MKNMMRMIAALLIAVMCLSGAALAAGKIKTTADVNIRKGLAMNNKTEQVRTVEIRKGLGLEYKTEQVRTAEKHTISDRQTGSDCKRISGRTVPSSTMQRSCNGKTVWATSKYSKAV